MNIGFPFVFFVKHRSNDDVLWTVSWNAGLGDAEVHHSDGIQPSRADEYLVGSVVFDDPSDEDAEFASRHQKREAEPKDNDINKLPVRNMHISTYKELATDGEVRQKHSLCLTRCLSSTFLSRHNYRGRLLKINRTNHFVNDRRMSRRNILATWSMVRTSMLPTLLSTGLSIEEHSTTNFIPIV